MALSEEELRYYISGKVSHSKQRDTEVNKNYYKPINLVDELDSIKGNIQ